MKPRKLLDNALTILANKKAGFHAMREGNIVKLLFEKYPDLKEADNDLDTSYLYLALENLVKDGYVTKNKETVYDDISPYMDEELIDVYQITLQGYIFINKGGYRKAFWKSIYDSYIVKELIKMLIPLIVGFIVGKSLSPH